MSKQMNPADSAAERRLRERLLLEQAAPGDRLMLADATLLAALEGSRPLQPDERRALQHSPLTLRRFRHLANQRRGAAQDTVDDAGGAANDPQWNGSHGMLRAAASAGALTLLFTDDGCWSLHFLPQGPAWQVVLKIDGEAPFAARLMRELPVISVVDGAGAIILQGQLDGDGECERAWPFKQAPAPHFHLCGAGFSVVPAMDHARD